MKIAIQCVIAAVAYVLGVALSGAIAPVLHIPRIEAPPGTSVTNLLIALMLALPLLTFAMAPLAAGIRGRWAQRWFAIALLMYMTIGLNTMLEIKIFTTMLAGNAWAASLSVVLPCVLVAAVLAAPMRTRSAAPSAAPMLGQFGIGGWTWRLVVSWLTFPVCYFAFGMIIAPIVMPYYKGGAITGLRIPPLGLLMEMLFLRSALFLAGSLPAIILWRKSRRQFIIAMGLAHAVTVGVFQLAQATNLPLVLRVTHSIEITADSFAYASVLGLLFIAPTRAAARQPEMAAVA